MRFILLFSRFFAAITKLADAFVLYQQKRLGQLEAAQAATNEIEKRQTNAQHIRGNAADLDNSLLLPPNQRPST